MYKPPAHFEPWKSHISERYDLSKTRTEPMMTAALTTPLDSALASEFNSEWAKGYLRPLDDLALAVEKKDWYETDMVGLPCIGFNLFWKVASRYPVVRDNVGKVEAIVQLIDGKNQDFEVSHIVAQVTDMGALISQEVEQRISDYERSLPAPSRDAPRTVRLLPSFRKGYKLTSYYE